jgi:hypothetical protein
MVRPGVSSSLKATAVAAIGIGFMFAVPTAVVRAGPCCIPGSLNPAAYQACLAGEALGGTCAGGPPAPQAPQAALPAPLPSLPPQMEPLPPQAPPPPPPLPAAPPGISPGNGEPAFCAGVRPPGTDSLCPITGLTR